jgi:hypothetical protein
LVIAVNVPRVENRVLTESVPERFTKANKLELAREAQQHLVWRPGGFLTR